MFTGIVSHCGVIAKIEKSDNTRRVMIHSEFEQLALGESIAVDGICVTVQRSEATDFWVDLSAETLAVTTASGWAVGGRVNLERALRMGDRLGGHFVLGHIDTVCEVAKIAQAQAFCLVEFSGIDPHNMLLLTHKGCVSINGVSLTINAITETGFTVMLIPHTFAHTNLNGLQIKQKVNIEFDTLNRIVARQLESTGAVHV